MQARRCKYAIRENMEKTEIAYIQREAMDASSVRRNPIIGSALLDLSPAAEIIANNVDLLTQILLCFPAKSLIRFKSVSKHWLSLISDSQFAAKHSRRNLRPSISGLFLCNRQTENPESVHENRPTLAFLDGIGVAQFRPKITHSCNGLLLCKYPSDHYLDCNPTTKTHTIIPDPPALSSWCVPRSSRAFLYFDPSKSPRYKVVFLGDCYSKVEKFYVYVYCSERASWNLILRNLLATMLTHEAFCGGVMYWLTDESVVLGFNIDSEKMIKKTYPPKSTCVHNVMFFGECDGRLILIQTRTISAVKFRIFEMDKDYGCWIVKFWVDLELLLSTESKLCYRYVLCVVKGDKEKDSELVLDLGGKVISYNLRCQTWNVLIDMAPAELTPYSHASPTAYPYIESLSPL